MNSGKIVITLEEYRKAHNISKYKIIKKLRPSSTAIAITKYRELTSPFWQEYAAILIAILAIFLNLSHPMISPKMKIIHNAKKKKPRTFHSPCRAFSLL